MRHLVLFTTARGFVKKPVITVVSRLVVHVRSLSSSSWGTRKRKEYNSAKLRAMADPKIEDILQPLRQKVLEQGDLVRKLKAEKATEIDVKNAITELKARRKALEDEELALTPKEEKFDRVKLEDLLKQRFFYDIAFAIYGGVAGLYDFGPMGCAMKSNLLQAWRKFFVLEEQMLEVDTSMITPEPVLVASGHVERFQDYMVKDTKSGECFRVDHLIEATFESMLAKKDTPENVKAEIRNLLPTIDNMDVAALTETLRKYNMMSPTTGNELTDPVHFNLMFATSIGPAGNVKAYLRPETAQGIFVNFKRLLDFKQGKLPFAAAQIGNAFRNEISPRSGLLRVREFTMAEIEHFCNPKEKDHPKFASVKDQKVSLLSACNQMDGKAPEMISMGDAVSSNLVANETLGYFMARIYLFLVKVGVDPSRLRFRQHMSNEMAHYACDCWDAEIKTSYGWVECVGCADRSCYDLTNHTKHTGARLSAEKKLDEPKIIDVLECLPQKGIVGKVFKKDAKVVSDYLSQLSEQEVVSLEQTLKDAGEQEVSVNGQKFVIKPDMVQVKRYQKKVHVEEIVPSVIEPSFGIGRIMYAIFEHTFKQREGDEQRTYLALPPLIAPYKCSILPLSTNPQFTPFINQLCSAMTEFDVSHTLDDSSGSIGRRYARTDQIAVPFGITVDFDTLKEPHTATLRERDSMKQVRAPIEVLPKLVADLSKGRISWDKVMDTYPVFETQEATTKK